MAAAPLSTLRPSATRLPDATIAGFRWSGGTGYAPGVGKTTTIRILATLLRPDGGSYGGNGDHPMTAVSRHGRPPPADLAVP